MVGKYFLRYAGESNMKHVSLETGGKSPNIVFADAGNLEHIAKTSADGVFYNSGQSCNAPTRILVEDKIRDEFVALMARNAKPWTPADPLDPNTSMGAVVDKDQMNRVLGYIAAGREEGATVAAGGAQARHCGPQASTRVHIGKFNFGRHPRAAPHGRRQPPRHRYRGNFPHSDQ